MGIKITQAPFFIVLYLFEIDVSTVSPMQTPVVIVWKMQASPL